MTLFFSDRLQRQRQGTSSPRLWDHSIHTHKQRKGMYRSLFLRVQDFMLVRFDFLSVKEDKQCHVI